MFTLSSYPPITCDYRVLLSLCVSPYVFLAYVPSSVLMFLSCASFVFLLLPLFLCVSVCAYRVSVPFFSCMCPPVSVIAFVLYCACVLCASASFCFWCPCVCACLLCVGVCLLFVPYLYLLCVWCYPFVFLYPVCLCSLMFLSCASFCVWSFSI